MQRKQNTIVLQRGDAQRIAYAQSCAIVTVRSVLAGKRSDKTDLGSRIMESARILQEARLMTESQLKEVASK